jgi:hypothetical protein
MFIARYHRIQLTITINVTEHLELTMQDVKNPV